MYEIEKGIPVPQFKYPFRDMKIGDSFLVPCDKSEVKVVRNRLVSAACGLKPRDAKFSCRTVAGGVRCWRIK